MELPLYHPQSNHRSQYLQPTTFDMWYKCLWNNFSKVCFFHWIGMQSIWSTSLIFSLEFGVFLCFALFLPVFGQIITINSYNGNPPTSKKTFFQKIFLISCTFGVCVSYIHFWLLSVRMLWLDGQILFDTVSHLLKGGPIRRWTCGIKRTRKKIKRTTIYENTNQY